MSGAAIEYYDIALYGYMVPILAKVFLPQLSEMSAYFSLFLFEFFAALCQVAGARFYGRMGDTRGRKKAMYYSMIGTSCITFLISVLPTYEMIGILATVLFACARATQSFFLGGEYNGGAIYCFEHEKNHNKYGMISGLYCSLTVLGIVIASGVALIVNKMGPEYFRFAYAISFVLAIATYSIRRQIKETPEYLKNINNKNEVFSDHKEKPKFFYNFIALAIVSLFFGIQYGLPTKILNAVLPISIGIDSSYIMFINMIFLIIYMVLLSVFGAASDLLGAKKIMIYSTLATAILTYPMMILIETGSLAAIIIAKAVFAILAAAFTGPCHAWAQSLFITRYRYRSISTAYALGKCCSTLILAISILVFEHYRSISGMGIILILTAIMTFRVLYNRKGE
jgi:MFS transporter, MHS family, proline/betaine transporter